METKTRQQAIDKMLLRMCNYYQQALTKDVLELYHLLWADQEVSDLAAACTIWMKENRWYPKADEIIKIIDLQKGPKIDIKTRALEQWRVVLQQLRRHGAYHPPSFSDPITAHLINNQFRWSYLAGMRESEEQWEQKRWIEAFQAAATVHQELLQIEVPDLVMGMIENVTNRISEPAERGESVPVEKIKAFRQMLEGQAAQDEKDLDRTNKHLNLQKGEL